MKQILIIIILFGLISCKNDADNTKKLQSSIDSLKIEIANIYKPGFGEIMGNVQAQHAKLWFAGKNHNWKLAQFEIKELNEANDAIKKYESARKESKLIDIIKPALDSINNAVKVKNSKMFNTSFVALTNACNNCHHLTNFGFNIVKIPDVSSFTNQDFKVK